ncbi:MAG: hypothetical protein ACJAS3_000736 [Roseivirga sp.]|jgi:hypothetical protein
MMDGNKKTLKEVKPINIRAIAMGEFTIIEEPVVAVAESKIPAEMAAKNMDATKKMNINM